MSKLFFIIFMVTASQAGVLKDMQAFFNGFGVLSNLSSGSAFEDQSAGYMTGGSLFVRNPVHSQNLAAVTAPGYRAGCGGINIWSGGFSYINSEGLKSALQSIVSNMKTYAFMLAIETYAPQIDAIISRLNGWAAEFNRFNINSCEAAAGILGGVWPKSDLGSQAACRMVSTQQGIGGDFVKARHDCGVGNQRDSLLSQADPALLVGEFNLAWKVLANLDFLLANNNSPLGLFAPTQITKGEQQLLKEVFMTLSGTIINRKSRGGTEEQITIASMGDREDLITGLMQGGPIEYYGCDEPVRCLRPALKKTHLKPTEALQGQITHILQELTKKVRNDNGSQEITPAEKSLINASHIPIYKILNVTMAYQKGRAPLNIVHHAELIAFDVAYKYINDVFDTFQDGINKLKAIQFTDVHITSFVDGIRLARHRLTNHRNHAIAKMDLLLGFLQKTQLLEKQIYSMLGAVSNEYAG